MPDGSEEKPCGNLPACNTRDLIIVGAGAETRHFKLYRNCSMCTLNLRPNTQWNHTILHILVIRRASLHEPRSRKIIQSNLPPTNHFELKLIYKHTYGNACFQGRRYLVFELRMFAGEVK